MMVIIYLSSSSFEKRPKSCESILSTISPNSLGLCSKSRLSTSMTSTVQVVDALQIVDGHLLLVVASPLLNVLY